MKTLVHPWRMQQGLPPAGGVHKMLYVGVDAHQARSMVTVMDEGGRVLKRSQVRSTPKGLRELRLQPANPHLRILRIDLRKSRRPT